MKMNFRLLLVSAAFLLAACSPSTLPELSETHIFADFGFSIDYPPGWSATTEGPVSYMAQTETDFLGRYDFKRKVEGILISLDHRSIDFLRTIGFTADPPTLDELFAFNIGELTGMTNPGISEATIFGVPALRSEYYETNWEISYAGLIGDEAFFFFIAAPSEEMLEEFKPTMEAMISSIRPITGEGSPLDYLLGSQKTN